MVMAVVVAVVALVAVVMRAVAVAVAVFVFLVVVVLALAVTFGHAMVYFVSAFAESLTMSTFGLDFHVRGGVGHQIRLLTCSWAEL